MVSEALTRIEGLRSSIKAAQPTPATLNESVPATMTATPATAPAATARNEHRTTSAEDSRNGGGDTGVVLTKQQQQQQPETATVPSLQAQSPPSATTSDRDPTAHDPTAHCRDHSPPRSFSQLSPSSSFSSSNSFSSSSRTSSSGSNGSSSGGSGNSSSSAREPARTGGGVLSSLWSAVVKAPHQSTTLPAPYAVPFDGVLLRHDYHHSGGWTSSRDAPEASNEEGIGSYDGNEERLVGWPVFAPPRLGRTSLRLAQDLSSAQRVEFERRSALAFVDVSSSSSSSSMSECKNEDDTGRTNSGRKIDDDHTGGRIDGKHDGDTGNDEEEQHDRRRAPWGLKSRQKQPQSQWARCSSCGTFVARGVDEISDHIGSCEDGGAVSAYQGTFFFLC